MTVCQVHTATCALVRSWWLEQPVSRKLLETTARRLRYQQMANAKARQSHRKRIVRKYHELGIRLSKTITCQWATG